MKDTLSKPVIARTLKDQHPMRTIERRRWRLKQQDLFGFLLLLPAAVIITLFITYPVIYSFFLTFSEFSVREQRWFAAGLSNYQLILSDRSFRYSLFFTLSYTAVYVPLSVGLALVVGVLLQQIKIGTTFFRSLLFLPTVVPVTMGFLMFQWILDPANGILNYVLDDALGMPFLAHNWLSDRNTVFGTLVTVTLWGYGPWILILAGLFAIPKDLYEAARVDGASHVQEFLFITLPQLRATLMVVTTLQLVRTLKVFVPIYILTSGGPANASNSLYFLVFQKISENKLAYATTVGWVFTLIIVAGAILTSFIFRTRSEDAQ